MGEARNRSSNSAAVLLLFLITMKQFFSVREGLFPSQKQKPTQPFRVGHVGVRNPNKDNPSRVAWLIFIIGRISGKKKQILA
jgi:hypothetical protein